MTPRFRPQLSALESREVPALNVLYTGASLTLTGTPTAGGTDSLLISHTGANNFKVTDGALNLGTYHVTRDVRVRLASFDTSVELDLGGATLGGSVEFDLGAGDTNPSTDSGAGVNNSSGAGKIRGDVTFRGGAGTEYNYVSDDGSGATLDIGGSVRAIGKPVTTPIEDTLFVGSRTEVHGDVSTSRVTYTTIYGTVDGDLTANTIDTPGGMAFELGVTGVVHGDVTATGGATAPTSPEGTSWYSYAYLNGAVDGDVRFTLTSGRAYIREAGVVEGDYIVRATGGPDFVTVAGEVGGDVRYTSGDATNSYFTLAYPAAVGGNLKYTSGDGGTNFIDFNSRVDGDVAVNLGGPNTTYSDLIFEGAVGGSATVTGRPLATGIAVYGLNWGLLGHPDWKTIGGDLTVKLGTGANSLHVYAAGAVDLGDYGANPIGGKLTYTGGSGSDTVTFDGQSTFKAKIDTGAGSDTVAFTPAATVGSLDVDFGADLDTWTPPTVITFPLKIKNLG